MKNVFSNNSITIRPYRSDDVEPLYEAVRESIDEIAPWLPWCHPAYVREDSKAWVTSREPAWKLEDEYSFVVEDTNTRHFLGGIGINQIDRIHNIGNLGYWVRTSEAGRGIATAATRLAAHFAFEQIRLHRLEILAVVENIGSQRVAEKAGAKREGVLRHRLYINGNICDAVLFSLLPEDLV
jgi:ribosomal-protein-serine acetyltransferase